MCSQFDAAEREDVIERWGIIPQSNVLGSAKWGTIYPKYDTLLITYDNEPMVRRWGLTPEWSKRPLINAKSEEVHRKKTFIPLLQSRCIIPAAAYYEWQRKNDSKIKTRIFGESMFSIAGLYTRDHYVMFTCAPAEGIAHIHHRMPVILDDQSIDDWLNPYNEFSDIKTLLQPFGGLLEWDQTV